MAKLNTIQEAEAISEISVAGLKSIGRKQTIAIRPLTILAGTNSSGKSSMMQGILLLKQTLEATYDPGPLLLYGPNVKFTKVDQLLSKSVETKKSRTLEIGLGLAGRSCISLHFQEASRGTGLPISIGSQLYRDDNVEERLSPEMTLVQLKDAIRIRGAAELPYEILEHQIQALRCFLRAFLSIRTENGSNLHEVSGFTPLPVFVGAIRDIFHVPGIRGNAERTYPLTPVSGPFAGTFIPYFASVVADWTRRSTPELNTLADWLSHLGLTWKVEGHAIDDTRVELRVGRLPQAKSKGSKDLVDIADVGLGVSHLLPVLVAMLVAKPGQLVYIEQPEIHLHPRAQFALAQAFVDSANRGVRVVVETHSSLFLTGVQTLVAEGSLEPEKVKLHWFKRIEETGETEVKSGDLDQGGRFGNWPEDFDDVILESEGRYINAAEAKLAKGL